MRIIFYILFIIQMLFVSNILSNESNNSSESRTEIVFYISSNGNDENAGTKESPFLTLERAKLAIKNNMGKSITLYLREGYYPLEKSFVLSKDDITEETPILISSFPGEKAHIIGGKEVNGFTPIDPRSEVYKIIEPEFRDSILTVNLSEKGITEFGNLSARGFGRAIQASGLTLYFNEKPMTLARWPNNDWS